MSSGPVESRDDLAERVKGVDTSTRGLVRRRPPTAPPPRRLRDRSKYSPHQSIRERMRRVGQILRGQIQGGPIDEQTMALYLDYTTTKAGGGDLTRFSVLQVDMENLAPEEWAALQEAQAEAVQDMSEEPKGLIHEGQGLTDVQVLSEAGPDTAPSEGI